MSRSIAEEQQAYSSSEARMSHLLCTYLARAVLDTSCVDHSLGEFEIMHTSSHRRQIRLVTLYLIALQSNCPSAFHQQ